MSAPPSRKRYPLEYRWDTLPTREVRPAPRRRTASLSPGAEWHETGPRDQPFDFSAAIARLTEDIAIRSPHFSHLQASRILIGFVQARTGERHGLQARVTPLRFEGGEIVRIRRGVPFQVQRYFEKDKEFLYLMTFCLPRFLEREFDDKLITLFHELYHIGPKFDGDLRRHEGRCHLHTHSKAGYDRHMSAYANEYLQMRPDPRLLGFLRMDYAQLKQRHGMVAAAMVPRPRLVPIQQ
ncbi:MAG: putative metallopeptidase [Gemmataceae bacterium]